VKLSQLLRCTSPLINQFGLGAAASLHVAVPKGMFGQFQPNVLPFKSTHTRPVEIEPSEFVSCGRSPVTARSDPDSDWTVAAVSRTGALVAPELFKGIMASTSWFETTRPAKAASNTKHPRTDLAGDICLQSRVETGINMLSRSEYRYPLVIGIRSSVP
jgi:hypothetical protein